MSSDPNDLGDFQVMSDNLVKLKITEYLRQVRQQLKESLVSSQLEIDGIKVVLSYSFTKFGGRRLWFCCPNCQCRVGVLFRDMFGRLGCRSCLHVKYKKQRYKGMIEQTL